MCLTGVYEEQLLLHENGGQGAGVSVFFTTVDGLRRLLGDSLVSTLTFSLSVLSQWATSKAVSPDGISCLLTQSKFP